MSWIASRLRRKRTTTESEGNYIANSIVTAVWRIDTAPFSYAFPVKVTNLNVGDSTAGDHVVVTDINNNTLVDFTSNGAQYRVGPLGWTRGIKIASGGLGASSVVEIAIGSGK